MSEPARGSGGDGGIGPGGTGAVPAVPVTAATPPAVIEPPPLRAVFLVWPGRVHPQTWLFLWIGVTWLVAALLPWGGRYDSDYVLRDGSVTGAAEWRLAAAHASQDPTLRAPAEIVAVRAPDWRFGQILVLLCALGVIATGISNIWNRKLTLWPSLLTWIVAFLVVYYSRGVDVSPSHRDLVHVKGLEQVADAFDVLTSHLGDLFAMRPPETVSAIFGRFGVGWYLCVLTELFLVVFILGSLVLGSSAKKGSAASRDGSRRARR